MSDYPKLMRGRGVEITVHGEAEQRAREADGFEPVVGAMLTPAPEPVPEPAPAPVSEPVKAVPAKSKKGNNILA